ncbi:MAG: tRNA pseudouridine55 synthase [Flavobacteriales bacterium]|jgi:tRNA pseudouridine55 synthase|tara:strand:- start:15273 stop:15959 length:687 start_codon:yes stop_codon:yes gene_type:complete
MLPFNVISEKKFEEYNEEELKTGAVFLVDKPLDWTSFQVVNKLRWVIRKTFKIKKIKVGHAGTLDPLATGLLIICVGKKTKEIDTYQGKEKEYTGTITVGGTTASFDLEEEIDQIFPTEHITEEELQDAALKLTGEIEQYPPIFSAVKIDGKRAYESARKGEEVKVKPRQVSVSKFDIDTSEFPKVHFTIVCSKGTYIRSMASDFGKLLDNGAHLSALRRERIGEFSL